MYKGWYGPYISIEQGYTITQKKGLHLLECVTHFAQYFICCLTEKANFSMHNHLIAELPRAISKHFPAH